MHRPAGDGVRERLAWPDHAIGELAATQGSMITTAQLRALGVSHAMIGRAVARGRLHRVHHGVHSLMLPRARPQLAAAHAALLACGPRALLSHHTAATLHGLRTPDARARDRLHVTVVGGTRAHAGLIVHRTATLYHSERVRVGGLRVTSVARTVLDLAPRLTDSRLEPLIDQALRVTSRTKLDEVVDRHPRRPGGPRLRRLLAPERPSADTWSGAERRLRAAILRSGLPAPESNVALGNYVADLLWRRQRVIVEYDSYAFHSGPAAFHHDRTRHNELAAHGRHRLLHVTARQVETEPERVLVWIATALAHADADAER